MCQRHRSQSGHEQHSRVVLDVVVCLIAYTAIIVETLRWHAQSRATRREFAALPTDRQTAAMTEYDELRQISLPQAWTGYAHRRLILSGVRRNGLPLEII